LPGTSSRPLFSNCGLLNFPLEADKAINASSYATGARAIRMEPPTLNSEEPVFTAEAQRHRGLEEATEEEAFHAMGEENAVHRSNGRRGDMLPRAEAWRRTEETSATAGIKTS